MYIIFCCVTYFALSTEQTWPDLHFTTDYILYNWVCDEQNLESLNPFRVIANFEIFILNMLKLASSLDSLMGRCPSSPYWPAATGRFQRLESIPSRRIDSSFRAFFSSTMLIYWCLSRGGLHPTKAEHISIHENKLKVKESVLRSSEFEDTAFQLRSTIHLPPAQ